MTEQYQDRTVGESAFAAARDRRARRLGEPFFTAGDFAAYAVALVMVCGPLAFGAFGL
ncbi:MAG: hypothetical protein IOC86_14945 [Aestuariivirga sp.]|nr:hypothetical protein [Aestuariivirga sp.]